jgi:hypothetical protein
VADRNSHQSPFYSTTIFLEATERRIWIYNFSSILSHEKRKKVRFLRGTNSLWSQRVEEKIKDEA